MKTKSLIQAVKGAVVTAMSNLDKATGTLFSVVVVQCFRLEPDDAARKLLVGAVKDYLKSETEAAEKEGYAVGTLRSIKSVIVRAIENGIDVSDMTHREAMAAVTGTGNGNKKRGAKGKNKGAKGPKGSSNAGKLATVRDALAALARIAAWADKCKSGMGDKDRRNIALACQSIADNMASDVGDAE